MLARYLIFIIACMVLFVLAFRLRHHNRPLASFLFVLAVGIAVLMAGGFFGFFRPY